MTYVYDILLNYSDVLYDFYEWEKKDNVLHIKKIPVFKVEDKIINDIIDYNIKVDNDFLKSIENNTEKYDFRKINYACIFSNSEKVIALLFNEEGEEIKRSKLLMEDEDEVNSFLNNKDEYNLKYEKIKKANSNLLLTRKELTIRNKLLEDLKKSYKNKNYQKISYLYLECFNKKCDDIKDMYNSLTKSLSNNFSNIHMRLYDILLIESGKK